MQGMMKGNAGSSSSCSSVSRGGGGGGGGGGSPCGSLRGRRSVMGERGRRTAAMLQRKRVNVTRRAATRKEGFDGAVGKEGGGGVGAEEEEEMAMPLQGQQEEQNTKRESKRTSVASVETAAVNEVFQTGTRMAPGTCIRYSNQASSLLFPSECRVCVCVCISPPASWHLHPTCTLECTAYVYMHMRKRMQAQMWHSPITHPTQSDGSLTDSFPFLPLSTLRSLFLRVCVLFYRTHLHHDDTYDGTTRTWCHHGRHGDCSSGSRCCRRQVHS